MDVLGQQKDLLARIDQTADRKHGVVFADIRIKKNRVASGIDDGSPSRPAVRRNQSVKHARRGRNHRVRRSDATDNRFSIPLQPARGPRRATLHRLRPTDQVTVSHHHARNIDRKIAVAELVELQQIRMHLTHQVGQKFRGLGKILRSLIHPLQPERCGPVFQAVQTIHP